MPRKLLAIQLNPDLWISASQRAAQVDDARSAGKFSLHFCSRFRDAIQVIAEDLDFETRRQLGNFPQAYSHLALIDCALELEGDDEEDEHDVLIEP